MFEGVVPPFAVVRIEAAVLHDGAEVVPVSVPGKKDAVTLFAKDESVRDEAVDDPA